MERVLVTGGAGFIGSHVVEELLSEGYEVAILDNFKTGNKSNILDYKDKVKCYEMDLLDSALINVISEFSPDYVIHHAAQVSVASSVNNIIEDAEINILGSLNLINAIKDTSAKKIIFASTAAVYGNPTELPVRTDFPANPQSPYGLSKLSVESYLAMCAELYNLKYTVLRYANVYGPKQDAHGEGGVVAIFADRLAANQDVAIFGDGSQTRDFIYVKDVAKANVKALKNGENNVLNISTNTETSIIQLIDLMKEKFSSNITPSFLEERKGDIKHSRLSNEEAVKALSWQPSVTIEDGLEETINHYQLKKQLV